MQKDEFEALTGREFTQEQYERIESVYMSLPNVGKDTFAFMYSNTPSLYNDVERLSRRANSMEKSVNGYRSFCIGIGERILSLHIDDNRIDMIAKDCMGDVEFLKYKVLNGFTLNDDEKEQIETVFNNLKQ